MDLKTFTTVKKALALTDNFALNLNWSFKLRFTGENSTDRQIHFCKKFQQL